MATQHLQGVRGGMGELIAGELIPPKIRALGEQVDWRIPACSPGDRTWKEVTLIENVWKVQFRQNGKRVFRKFEGNSPIQSGAVEFGKDLKNRGISIDVISVRKAYPPPYKNKKKQWLGRQEAPHLGLLWCPYCIKWREFHYAAISSKDGISPELFRCPVCTISIRDHYIQLYNPDMFMRLDIEQEVKEAMRIKRRTVAATSTRRRRARR